MADAIAQRFSCQSHEREDLRQVARLALVEASTRYREGSARGFVPYAVATIEGEIKHHLRDRSWMVRPPRPILDLRIRLRRAVPRLQQSLGREPTAAEIGRELGVAAAAVSEAMVADSALLTVPVELSAGDAARADVRSDVRPLTRAAPWPVVLASLGRSGPVPRPVALLRSGPFRVPGPRLAFLAVLVLMLG